MVLKASKVGGNRFTVYHSKWERTSLAATRYWYTSSRWTKEPYILSKQNYGILPDGKLLFAPAKRSAMSSPFLSPHVHPSLPELCERHIQGFPSSPDVEALHRSKTLLHQSESQR